MSREFSLSLAYSTYPAHIKLLEWITLVSCGEGSKPRFLLRAFNQRPLTVSLLHHILCSAPFYQTSSILGAFAKLRKATVSFVMFCLSARNNSTPTRRIFMKFNPLTPNDLYMSRTALLTSKCCILCIYSTNVGNEYFKHALYSLFFSLQNAVCFVMLTCLVPVLFTFYIKGVLKLKKKIPAPKG